MLRVAISLSLLSISFLACDLSYASDPSNSTQELETVADPSPLPIVTEPVLPRLSESEIETLQTQLTVGIDTWFGLAGLDKTPAPPPFSEALQAYREQWGAINPDIATFVGFWQNDEAYPYSVTIFPSNTPGQVCVLEFKPEWSLQILNEATGEYGKDMISEQILSVSIATVQDGHLRSSQVRSVGSATALARYGVGEAYPVLFMSIMDDQGTTRTVAAISPPALPAELPESLVPQVSQALSDYGCTVASPTSRS
ncbi:hypothetical protein H6G89_00935 [Oscillatoria sp. FACHB-1407]|uniref:hypothetical protein n=1 Tax=Oscillatoria sp. FACHB-1407 TaxID=2692847 RepID=UPI001685E282|nr:hypothetical protein [Oscillatoria sp. FACHB-1407]MBD2459595.1 hypothetical protein [Oscillatoria sp. FACHB-1407]